MIAKKTDIKPKVDLKDEINRLMTPSAAKELQGLSPTFQQFLIRWTDLRDSAMMEEVKEFIQNIYVKDNEQMCKNIAEIVITQNKKMFWTLNKQTLLLKKIGTDILEIKNDIIEIKNRLDNHEKRIKILESKL